METEETQKQKRLHYAIVLLLSFLFFTAGFAIEQTFRWTNHFDGFMNGLIQGAIFGVTFCLIFILPWSLLIHALCRWRRSQESPNLLILAPSILFFIAMIGSLVIDPPNPRNRFKEFANTELPSNASNFHYRFTGGGIVDYQDTYYFTTTPAEVKRMIAEMNLEEDEIFDRKGMSPTNIDPLPGCPDFSSWEGAKQFKGWDDQKQWFYYLITDATKTKVYMKVGCI